MKRTVHFVMVFLTVVNSHEILDKTIKRRNDLINEELNMMLGSDIVLSDSESKANDIIMKLKNKVCDEGFHYPNFFNVSKHFFEYKDKVKKTMLFKILKKMPKGAVLHAHDMGLLSPDYMLELTYLKNLYVCFEDDQVHFKFAASLPKNQCRKSWQSMKDARYSSGNVEEFDAELRRYFTIVTDSHQKLYTDINIVWHKFATYFMTSIPLMAYKPVWEQYFYDTLKTFREDNIMYLEIRSVLPELYDLEGNIFDSVATAESYKKVLDLFMMDFPDFLGAKLIYAPLRMVSEETVDGYIRTAKEIKRKFPDFLAGFDLVGQEDLGMPILKFMPYLVAAKDELEYFFHAGETNWSGTETDENIADAIVLGTKRIGHGFALVKHPVLMEEVKKRDIALEVNVISNNVLKLVEDVRNHPAATFIARGLPVVISSDDPGVWEAEPLTHDFYVTFVGVANRRADLRLLKKLALNSLNYSTYGNKEKMITEFEVKWQKFIEELLKS